MSFIIIGFSDYDNNVRPFNSNYFNPSKVFINFIYTSQPSNLSISILNLINLIYFDIINLNKAFNTLNYNNNNIKANLEEGSASNKKARVDNKLKVP